MLQEFKNSKKPHEDSPFLSKHQRIYGFVTTADGEDLAERLIRMGLARAFGVFRETPGAKAAKEYQGGIMSAVASVGKRAEVGDSLGWT